MTGTTFGGPWTLRKLDILKRYLNEYTTVLKNQPFNLVYVDAFAGEGYFSLDSEQFREDYADFKELHTGSARIALEIEEKPFDKLVFSEINAQRYDGLMRLRQAYPRRDIEITNEDANAMLSRFCEQMESFDRAVVFLDPFATSVSWSTIEGIAKTKRIDCWILFPVGAIARMMPRQDQPSEALANQLDRIFGDRVHWQDFYERSRQMNMFEDEPGYERLMGSRQIAERYRQRLEDVFHIVAPTRRTLVNSKNSPMFELFFGASNPIGAGIAVDIADYILKHW